MKTRELVDRLATEGQERLGRVSNDLRGGAVGAARSRMLEARATVDRLGAEALAQLNVATAADVAALDARVGRLLAAAERLEGLLVEVAVRLDRIESALATEGADPGPPGRELPGLDG